MRLINSATHEEISDSELRARFSTATAGFSNPMTEAEVNTLGYTILHETDSGATEFQHAARVANALVDGQWTMAWTLTSKTLQELGAMFEGAVQDHLDAAAKASGYDNIVSACSYAGAANPYQAQGIAYVAWRGAVWAQCYTDLTAISGGTKTMPASVSAYIATLPVAP